jgi:NAD(P)-dependent dehydrogenase (short-subunit alcohol dehydrogenase family)
MNCTRAATPAAIVTGAGSGIGRACAELLAGRGMHVICAGRTAETLKQTLAAVRAAGGDGEAVAADCATVEGVAEVTAAATNRSVATVVHAAGADLAKAFSATTADDFDRLIDVNVRAPFFLTQALLPVLADGAGLVFVGSISAVRGRDRHSAYGAAKAALIGLTANLAVELAPRIRVNCVSPGATRTGMLRDYIKQSTSGIPPDELERLQVADQARMPLRRVAEPAEVAASIVHLAVDATAVTGIDLAVDVGYSAS